MIVPQTFKKVLLTKEGTLKTETFTVSGRKIPLLEIRTRMLKEQVSLGLLRIHTDDYYTAMTDAEVRSRLNHLGEDDNTGKESELESKERLKAMERKRYLMVWGDNSTLLNHGHLLLTVNSVYDEALCYTSEEMKAKGKGDIDVQSIVEGPQVYILGRCGSSEVDQLAYINTRKAYLQSMNVKINTSNGVEITDVMRFFHGDGPEQQFEVGEQKGGNAGCASCSGDARKYKDLTVSLSRHHLTLSERLKKVLQGPAGKIKGMLV